MAKDHGPSVQDDKLYEELRDDGESKEKAARIANAKAGGSDVSRKGGEGESYEDRTKEELEDRAAELGIEGRSKMKQGRARQRAAQPLTRMGGPSEGLGSACPRPERRDLAGCRNISPARSSLAWSGIMRREVNVGTRRPEPRVQLIARRTCQSARRAPTASSTVRQ